MASCIRITSEEMKRNLIAILSGDVKKIEELIIASHNHPIPIAVAEWGGENIYIDSFLFSYFLYDALMFDNDDTYYKGRNIPEMLDLHKRLCDPINHPDYSKYAFVSWNDWDYLDEDLDKEEIALLKKDGARDIDLELTKAGTQHKEDRVIELLKEGATPYFLNLTEYLGQSNREIHYSYFEVAMLLSHLDSEWCDQWDIRGLTLLRKDISSLNDEDLELIVFDLFNAAASQRILYLVDKYISDEARAKGEELMRKYDAYYPILRHKPEACTKVTGTLCMNEPRHTINGCKAGDFVELQLPCGESVVCKLELIMDGGVAGVRLKGFVRAKVCDKLLVPTTATQCTLPEWFTADYPRDRWLDILLCYRKAT